jgi:hypothetical protein
MATFGYVPYQALWHFFHQSGHKVGVPLTEAQQKEIAHIVGAVTEHRMHPEGSTLAGRFEQLMQERNGQQLSPMYPHTANIVQGLLECLDPYQPYEPYTRPDIIRPGIYDHFKGGVYLVTGLSTWVSGGEPEAQAVEYLSMIYGTRFTRLATQWCEVVQWPDGKYRSRFVYRGSDLKTPARPFKVPSPEAHP